MPEGDTIYRAARMMNQALAGKTVRHFESPLVQLARVEVDTPVTGRVIENVKAQGKWNLMSFSGDLVLATHMRMKGSWHLYRPGERWQKSPRDLRILIETADFLAAGFNVPVAEFHTSRTLARDPRICDLGMDLLSADYDEASAAARLRAEGNREIGSVILDQRVLAGAGNVFKSEVLFVAGINPFRTAASLSPSEAVHVAAAARTLLEANARQALPGQKGTYLGWRRTTDRLDPTARLWVYRRQGRPCLRCGAMVVCRRQGVEARATLWCPHCQPDNADTRLDRKTRRSTG